MLLHKVTNLNITGHVAPVPTEEGTVIFVMSLHIWNLIAGKHQKTQTTVYSVVTGLHSSGTISMKHKTRQSFQIKENSRGHRAR